MSLSFWSIVIILYFCWYWNNFLCFLITGWWQYDERTMNDLEREYSSNKPTCQLLVAGHIYIVDFSQMIQYRSNNRNISRRIRREQNSLEKRGVAGIRLTTSAAAPSTSNNGSSPPPQPQGPASGTRRRRVNPPAAVSNPPGSAAPSSSSRPPTAHGDSPVQAVVLSSDEDSSVDVDEDYDSDYSDADDDMEIGEEEEALIGDDSDERETEDEEEIESRDGARAPTRRSDRSNSSNNQTPPPPSGGSVTNGSSRTYSPTSRGGSRGHRSGRSSGGGSRNGNGNSQSSSRSCPGSDPNTSSLLLLTNTYNLDPQININLNNNVYIDPQLRDSPISTISNVKVSFEKSSHRGREEFL